MKYFGTIAILLILFSCVRNKNYQNQTTKSNVAPVKNQHMVEVQDVIQTSKYTYLEVKELDNKYWIAVNRMNAQTGEIYYYPGALKMDNFYSRELDRTFEVVYFVSKISKDPKTLLSGGASTMMPGMQMNPSMSGSGGKAHSGKVQSEIHNEINLEKGENEITIEDIFTDREQFANKKIRITGVVVKVNNSIMGRNWIHIQDGTSGNGSFDLTMTSQDMVKVNDKVTFEGVISVNKDFGSGYSYDVIMENAVLVKNLDRI